jgi:tetratricopeptide (TPR) repeat protein
MLLASAVGDYRNAELRARAFKERHPDTQDRRSALLQLAAIAGARGALAESERYLREAMSVSAVGAHGATYLEDAVPLGFLDIWFRRQPLAGLKTVESALGRYPLTVLKPLDRPYLSLAFVYAVAGQPEKARALLTEYEREVKPLFRRGDEAKRRWTWGHVAMAEGRFIEAVADFQAFAASPRNCRPCGLASLAQAYDKAGQPDSAIAVYERYLSPPDLFRLSEELIIGNDATQLAPAHKRLGELYEQRGDRERAREHYARFVKLWKDCDPELRPAVNEVKQRLRQLGGESPATQ